MISGDLNFLEFWAKCLKWSGFSRFLGRQCLVEQFYFLQLFNFEFGFTFFVLLWSGGVDVIFGKYFLVFIYLGVWFLNIFVGYWKVVFKGQLVGFRVK